MINTFIGICGDTFMWCDIFMCDECDDTLKSQIFKKMTFCSSEKDN